MNDWNDPNFRKEYDKKRFQDNKAKRLAQNKVRQKMIKEKINEYKASKGCCRCPENDPVCLDFHHIDQNIKDIEIGNAYRNGWKIEKIFEEISKCIILCANCHRKEHNKIRNGM